ncbi:hypothetical protein [Paractinoplanes toevensis]|uniref:Uncharacterized protein n=1 Tax=Paractinoplanes toevensis TaxID=571911 RepID=A0A919W7B2_9ACTN|nr:hypothetical protein [Actinoplanes toevensis]GIM88731.1 hypothetical protein Ato02nite_005240 [Actinoplanes toevensis]
MEFLVCCVFAYWLVKHLPEVAQDTAEAIAAGWRGEESPRLAARRKRLEDAGIDPAAGGAFGQFAGNLWRDFWLDQDNKRQGRRSSNPRPEGDSGLFGRTRDAWDATVSRRAAAWRARAGNEDPTPPTPEAASDNPPPDAAQPSGADEPGNTTRDANQRPADSNTPEQDPPTNPAPVRVPSTTGTPVDQDTGPASGSHPEPAAEPSPALTAAPERTPDMRDVASRGSAVTGVVSGAAEARSIQRYLEGATEAYDVAMRSARARIHALGEQTIGIVQMATRSTVVDATAQAAESIAAAQNAANVCKAETIPLLGHVAREFDKRNS